ncbi:MAG: DUF3995 domain-containing protein [Microscillaceae bacterium]|jgi:hypothetical protein|nr:DUF3995 domain-containing protein [Microscillaceae bacterium]
MFINILIIFETLIFVVLSALHIYWALGGRLYWAAALPQFSSGKQVFVPSVGATWLVAWGLLGFAGATVAALPAFPHILSIPIVFWLNLAIGSIFLLRAIGDFKYIGFSKKIKNTAFARQDTRWYSPLCAVLAGSSFLIAFNL